VVVVVVVGTAVVEQTQVVVVVGATEVVVGPAVVLVPAQPSESRVQLWVAAIQIHLQRPAHGGGVVVVDVDAAAAVPPLLRRTTAQTVPLVPLVQRIWAGAVLADVLTHSRPLGCA
jgi:hypothetical protein